MSFINKVKNFFYEDVEEDDDEFEEREAAKREAKLRKIEEKRRKAEFDKVEKQRRQEIKEETREFIKPANDNLSERELFESERTFNFPMDLGDNIFDQTDYIPIEEVKEETRKEVKEEKNLYARTSNPKPATPSTPAYKSIADTEEPKKFHASPVVSPVYGILDKNYTVDDVVEKGLSKTKEFSFEKDKKSVDFDTVRNKAYKELDDEIEKTLTGKKDIFYNLDEDEKKEENEGTVEDFIEQEYDKDENDDGHGEDDVIITYDGESDYNHETVEEEVETKDGVEEDEDISPDVEIPTSIEPVKPKRTRRSKKTVEEPEEDDTEDDEKEDLFNLIDNMYNDEEDEEEDE